MKVLILTIAMLLGVSATFAVSATACACDMQDPACGP